MKKFYGNLKRIKTSVPVGTKNQPIEVKKNTSKATKTANIFDSLNQRIINSPFNIRGPLTRKEIIQAMHLCFLNSRELIEDAKILRSKKRNARALSLAILALEELARIVIFCNATLIPKNDQRTWRALWRRLNSHTYKQNLWSYNGESIAKQKNHPDAGTYKEKFPIETLALIDEFKQMGFYVTRFEDEFVLPQKFSDDNLSLVDGVIEYTEKRVQTFAPLHQTPELTKKMLAMGVVMVGKMLKKSGVSKAKFIRKTYRD